MVAPKALREWTRRVILGVALGIAATIVSGLYTVNGYLDSRSWGLPFVWRIVNQGGPYINWLNLIEDVLFWSLIGFVLVSLSELLFGRFSAARS